MRGVFFLAILLAVAPKPLYVDPVYDGAADPEIIRDRRTGEWYMFYTQRRANIDCPDGVSWAHGTQIGIARSKDFLEWQYDGTAGIDYSPDDSPSYWAPSIIDDGKLYHMFLTYVPGTFADWDHPRYIIHLTSRNLKKWKFRGRLQLCSDRVIDADVLQMPDGTFRMWYNSEPGGKLIAYADSPDLYSWQDRGPIPGIAACEAPKVFRWRAFWWMICDEWRGLAVYRSDDAVSWTRQSGNILQGTGSGASAPGEDCGAVGSAEGAVDDGGETDCGAVGHHCDVIVNGDRAIIFYFVHPDSDAAPGGNPRRSVVLAAELELTPDGIFVFYASGSRKIRKTP